jgi:putative DNA primase/helicase
MSNVAARHRPATADEQRAHAALTAAFASWERIFAKAGQSNPEALRDILNNALADLFVVASKVGASRTEISDWAVRVSDLHKIVDHDELQTIIVAALTKVENHSPPGEADHFVRLRPLDLNEFLALAVKPREMVLDPVIPEKGLAMVYAARGMGKTLFALGIGFAVATGTKFLKWPAPKPRRVLLVDGEMPAKALQERLARLIASEPQVELDPENLKVLAADLIEPGGIGNLASRDVQDELDRWLDDVDLVILDNLSSLTSVIRDNDAESWGTIQEWLLKLRRRGTSVLIVHHAGKGGQQRGTSRREDVLDTSISLRRPTDYSPTQGARFEIHLEKTRGFHGEAAKPFEAKLEIHDDTATWTIRELEDANRARVEALLEDGLSVRDIADETGIPKSTVGRIKKAIEAEKAEAGRA